MPREHGDRGRYVETTTHEDVLDVFEQVSGPVVISGDVADALDCSAETARRKLRELHREGALERRETPRTILYWRATTESDDSTTDPDAVLKRLSTDSALHVHRYHPFEPSEPSE